MDGSSCTFHPLGPPPPAHNASHANKPEPNNHHTTVNAPLRCLADADADELADWEASGNAAIARGHVACVVLATSLVPGAPEPAPRALEAPPGLPSGKCCLQLYAERILTAQALAARAAHGANAPVARPVHLYIMVSPDTRGPIEAALASKKWFGLRRAQVHVFECATALPCLDSDLRAVLR